MTDRIPPHNKLSEQSLLGACLSSDKALYEILETVQPEDFYFRQHMKIYEAIIKCSNNAVDMITVSDELERLGILETVGGAGYIAELIQSCPSAANATQYVDIVRDNANKRRLIQLASDMTDRAYSGDLFEDIISNMDSEYIKLTQAEQKSKPLTLQQITESLLEKMDREKKEPNKGKIKTFIPCIDHAIGRFGEGNLVLIAARPRMGKTALMINFALNMSKYGGYRTAIISIEMSNDEIAERVLSLAANVQYKAIHDRGLTSAQDERICEISLSMDKYPIEIQNVCNVNVAGVRAILTGMKLRNKDLKIAFIDYIQLMDMGKRSDRHDLEISETLRELKLIAKGLDIVMFVLCQLNRGAEGAVPKLAHLKDSGGLEEHADYVLFPFRPYVFRDYREFRDAKEDYARLIIAKGRHIKQAEVHMKWNGDYMRFYDEA